MAYVVHMDAWVKYDDLSGDHPRQDHPQTGIKAGGIAYFAIYEKQIGQKSFPYDAATNERSEGFVLTKKGNVPSFIVDKPVWRQLSTEEAKAAAEAAKKAKQDEEDARRAAEKLT